MSGPLFFCENLTCSYDTVPVIEGITVELPEKGFVSLVGPSGSGKTTLFKTLAGLRVPDSGRVMLGGADITGKAGRIGYMPQKDMLFPYRTVLDNTILPLVIRGEKKKAAREQASAYFAVFGLDGYQNRYPRELSGGMRQRAALLRTCMTANKVILLDEPFSALDAITRTELQAWYAETATRMGLSTFFITHDIDEAIKLSDTVYLLAGKPGHITLKQDISVEFCQRQKSRSKSAQRIYDRPRSPDFALSEEFLRYKRAILAQMGG